MSCFFSDSPLSEEDKDYNYTSGNLSETTYFSTKSNVTEMSKVLKKTVEKRRLNISVHSSALFCQYCDYSTKYRCALREHLKLHKEHPFKCQICGNVYTSNGNLKRHMMLHTGELPYECFECNERFKTNYYLKVHHLKHTGQRPFKCEYCPKSFIQRSHLNKHSRKHQNLVFKCSHCDFFSEFSKVFKDHMVSHNGKLRFRCDLCDYSCAQDDHLVQHMLKHTGSRPFTCNSCGCSFKSKINLERHSLDHSTGQKYKCQHCEFATDQAAKLNIHMLVHASELNDVLCKK